MNAANTECKISIPNRIEFLPLALGFVSHFANLAGFDPESCEKIVLSVEEGALNVIEHAFTPGESALFDIICSIQAVGITIVIKDMGMPFDSSKIQSYNPGETIEDFNLTGVGALLMKKFMDEIDYVNLGPAGKETRLKKYFPFASMLPGLISKSVDVQPVAVLEVVQEDLGQIEIRRMREEDAAEVSRCFFEVYRYTYAHEDAYFPERIAARNRDDELFSIVAVNKKGEVAAHSALIFNKNLPGVAEVAMGATKPKFQGKSLASQMGMSLIQEASRRNLSGIFSNTVTAHPISQKLLKKNGAHETGFLLAHNPATVSYKGIAEKLSDRVSIMIYFFSLVSAVQTVKIIFPPSKHKEAVLGIYKNLGWEVSVGNAASPETLEGLTRKNLGLNYSRLAAVLHFVNYGIDIEQQFHACLYQIKKDGMQVLECYLNLSDPHTPYVSGLMEKAGFMFTGILPGTTGGDRLIMQYFNGIVIDYDSVKLYADEAKQLLDYVRRNDPMDSLNNQRP